MLGLNNALVFALALALLFAPSSQLKIQFTPKLKHLKDKLEKENSVNDFNELKSDTVISNLVDLDTIQAVVEKKGNVLILTDDKKELKKLEDLGFKYYGDSIFNFGDNPLAFSFQDIEDPEAVFEKTGKTSFTFNDAFTSVPCLVSRKNKNSRGGRLCVADSETFFTDDLLQWITGAKGDLRMNYIKYGSCDNSAGLKDLREKEFFIVKQDIYFEVSISEFAYQDLSSSAFKEVSFKDDQPQLELTMIDPYIRVNLDLVNSSVTQGDSKDTYRATTFGKCIKLPDQYGVYTFRTVFKRPFYSPVEDKVVIPIRQLRHDMYDRFLVSAYPYYTAMFSMLAGFVLLSVTVLFYDDKNEKKDKKE